MARNELPSTEGRGLNEDIFEDDVAVESQDLEVEERVADWLETNKVENDLPSGTLYKFSGPTGESREQVDYFRGIIPSRHEIGLNYGAGRYLLMLRNTTSHRNRKNSSVRFILHESYNDKSLKFRRERAEETRLAIGQVSPIPTAPVPAQSGKESLMEAFTLVRSMQADTMNMFRPLMERLLTPPAAVIPAKTPTPFEEYALTRQILKDNLKENVSMFSDMQKALMENRPVDDRDDRDDDLGDEKQTMFDKIIALAEPFINILAQNNMAAKMAAAGIKAAPQFKEVIRDATLAKRIISYVETKEGPERAAIALKNLGISKADYGPTATNTPVSRPRSPAPAPRRPVESKKPVKPAGKGSPVNKLNPKMEVKV